MQVNLKQLQLAEMVKFQPDLALSNYGNGVICGINRTLASCLEAYILAQYV